MIFNTSLGSQRGIFLSQSGCIVLRTLQSQECFECVDRYVSKDAAKRRLNRLELFCPFDGIGRNLCVLYVLSYHSLRIAYIFRGIPMVLGHQS